MNDFVEMIREALLGEEPHPPDPDREALEASMRKLDQRTRTARGLAAVMVLFGSAVFAWGLIALLRAGEETHVTQAVLYGALFVVGASGVSFGKLWYAMMLNHHAVLKELKRAQLRTLEP